jgi:hypothetical protein
VHSTPDHLIATLAMSQRGLLTVEQAGVAGLSADQIRQRVARGSLTRVAGGVLSVAGHDLTWDRRLLAACLAAGPDSVVSHRAAAHLLGFDGFARGPIEVTVPRGVRPPLPRGVRLHSALRLDRIDVVSLDPFRVTSGARTILDLARTATEQELVAAIGSAIRDGWTSEAVLRRRLSARRGRGHHGVRLLDVVLDGPIGDSELERRFLRLVTTAGLPRPVTQRVFRGDRTIRVDASWEPYGVVAEVMGHRWHCTALDLARDAHRRNELESLGLRVLEFTAHAIDREPAVVVDTPRRNLRPPAV